MRPALCKPIILLGLCILLSGSRNGCVPPPIDPERVAQQQANCRSYLDKADFEAAKASCSLCLEWDRFNAECTNLMGLRSYLMGDFAAARDWYKRAIRLKNDFPEARNNLGVLLMEQDGDLEKAITMFSSTLKIDPGYLDGRWNLALAHSRLGNQSFARARQQVEEQGLNGADPKVLMKAYAPAEEHYTQAAEQARRLLELAPLHAKAAYLLGHVEEQRAHYALTQRSHQDHLVQSNDWLHRCVDLAAPGSREARECRGNLGSVEERLGQCDRAWMHYAGCLAAAPHDPECQRGLDRTHTCLSVRSGALRMAMQHLQANPGDAQEHLQVCVMAAEAGLMDVATSSCENALLLDPSLCQAHAWLVRCYSQMLNGEQTRQHCAALLGCGAKDDLGCQELLHATVTSMRIPDP